MQDLETTGVESELLDNAERELRVALLHNLTRVRSRSPEPPGPLTAAIAGSNNELRFEALAIEQVRHVWDAPAIALRTETEAVEALAFADVSALHPYPYWAHQNCRGLRNLIVNDHAQAAYFYRLASEIAHDAGYQPLTVLSLANLTPVLARLGHADDAAELISLVGFTIETAGSNHLRSGHIAIYAQAMEQLSDAAEELFDTKTSMRFREKELRFVDPTAPLAYARMYEGMARSLLIRGDDEAAERALTTSQRLVTNNTSITRFSSRYTRTRAQMTFVRSGLDAALGVLDAHLTGLKTQSDSMLMHELLITRGVLLMRGERWSDAYETLRDALSLPLHKAAQADVNHLLGTCLNELGRHAEAFVHLKGSVEHNDRRHRPSGHLPDLEPSPSDRLQELRALLHRSQVYSDDADGLRERIVQSVVHDVFTALSPLTMAFDMDRADSALVTLVMASIDSVLNDVVTLEPVRTSSRHGTPIDVARLSSELIAEFQKAAELKNLTVTLTVDKDVIADGDRDDLHRILANLWSNAIKFTPADGHISLEARAFGPDRVVVHVIDSGPGISDDDRRQLFEWAVRGSAGPTASESSTGLGLNIAKTLVSRMRGTLTVASDPHGSGSAFNVILPAHKDGRPPPRQAPLPPGGFLGSRSG